MAYEEILRTISLRAPSTAFTQYCMVKASSSGGYFIAGSTKPTGEKISKSALGVLQEAPSVSGDAYAIAPFGSGGISKLVCGSTKLSPGKNFIMGTVGTAQSTGSIVAQDTVYGPWLSAAASTDTIGSAVLSIVGITT